MRSLTIIQPFAHLIASGEKRVENRTWPTSFCGLLAIHAGKARSYGGESIKSICEDEGIDYGQLPFGAVVAVARLVTCVRIETGTLDGSRLASIKRLPAALHWLADHVHAEGPVCWVLEDVRRLLKPVPCNGAQGLWDLPEDIEAAVKMQLDLAGEAGAHA